MPYRLNPGEGMATGVRRIVDEQIERAVDQLEGRRDGDRDAAVHDARKSLKKSRSALRLVRYDLGGARAAENAVMRDAGRRLGGVRDAQVLLETLASLAGGTAPLPAAGSRALREALEARRGEMARAVHEDGGAAAEVARELRELRERIPGWPLEDEGFASARKGLRRIHERGRTAMERAFRGGDDEAWHEWRKRVKDLWYSARIVEPVAPVPLGAIVTEADELSDLLGAHNDLAVLLEAIGDHAGALAPGDAVLLRDAAAARRDDLRRTAVPLGRRLYAESSRGFARRVGAYWDAGGPEAEQPAGG